MIGLVNRKFGCPCCGFLTLTDRTYWSFEICPVCFWENDPLQEEDPLYWGGANGISLVEGIENFGRCGASHPDEEQRVRAPGTDEMPGAAIAASTAKSLAVRRTKAQVNAIARGIAAGKIEMLSGCRAMASLALSIPREPELYRLLWVFEAVGGEADRFRDEVELACKALQEYLRAEFAG
jgi:hypothetical protein